MRPKKIVRETNKHYDIYGLGVYFRTVVYAQERVPFFGIPKRIALFTYVKQQDFKIPIRFHPAPWKATAECLDFCSRGQVIGYKQNYWRIMRFQWLNKELYNELKSKAT